MQPCFKHYMRKSGENNVYKNTENIKKQNTKIGSTPIIKYYIVKYSLAFVSSLPCIL